MGLRELPGTRPKNSRNGVKQSRKKIKGIEKSKKKTKGVKKKKKTFELNKKFKKYRAHILHS